LATGWRRDRRVAAAREPGRARTGRRRAIERAEAPRARRAGSPRSISAIRSGSGAPADHVAEVARVIIAPAGVSVVVL
jgi:hypothetical protein